MEYRLLGGSGFSVPALSFGTATFGGDHPFFAKWGNTNVDQARRLVDICIEAGANLFDTANVYSTGQAEEVLGEAISGRRSQVLLSTKANFLMFPWPFRHSPGRPMTLISLHHVLMRVGKKPPMPVPPYYKTVY